MRPLLALLTLGVVCCLPSGALAEPKPKCPAGQRPSLSGCVHGSPAQLRTAPGAEPRPATPKPVPRPDPTLSAAHAAKTPLEHQSRVFLMRELTRLEALLKSTPENSPDYPVLLHRLGDGYAELERLAEQERAKAQAAADDAERAERAAPPRKRPRRGIGTFM